MVVDDHEDVAKMSAMLLQSWGYEVLTAYSGEEALQAADGFNPRIILLDIDMPDMDGYETARRIRGHPALQGVRLVSVTGYGHDIDLAYWREAGFDDSLVKPVEPGDLKQVLDRHAALESTDKRRGAGQR